MWDFKTDSARTIPLFEPAEEALQMAMAGADPFAIMKAMGQTAIFIKKRDFGGKPKSL